MIPSRRVSTKLRAIHASSGASILLSVGTSRDKLLGRVIRRDCYPVEFALGLVWKDLGNARQLAQERGVPMLVTAVAQQMCAIEETKDRDEDSRR